MVTKLFEGVTLPGTKDDKEIDNRQLTRKLKPNDQINHVLPNELE